MENSLRVCDRVMDNRHPIQAADNPEVCEGTALVSLVQKGKGG